MASVITNSFLFYRHGDPIAFDFTKSNDGNAEVYLNNYVVIPVEQYGTPLHELFRFNYVPPVPPPEPEEMLEWDTV